jgi:hypothetical protein
VPSIKDETDTTTPLATSTGFVPITRTINTYALDNDISLTKEDIGLTNVQDVDTTTTQNITDYLNKRFVTDAQITLLGNTSGSNTGDETASTIRTKLGITTLSGSNT